MTKIHTTAKIFRTTGEKSRFLPVFVYFNHKTAPKSQFFGQKRLLIPEGDKDVLAEPAIPKPGRTDQPALTDLDRFVTSLPAFMVTPVNRMASGSPRGLVA